MNQTVFLVKFVSEPEIKACYNLRKPKLFNLGVFDIGLNFDCLSGCRCISSADTMFPKNSTLEALKLHLLLLIFIHALEYIFRTLSRFITFFINYDVYNFFYHLNSALHLWM